MTEEFVESVPEQEKLKCQNSEKCYKNKIKIKTYCAN